MGAESFGVVGKGATAKDAFYDAQEEARYEHGHSGYTGTIAEKNTFVMITVPAGHDPVEYANALVESRDPRVDDKWGPAGCVKISDGAWYFFGVASC